MIGLYCAWYRQDMVRCHMKVMWYGCDICVMCVMWMSYGVSHIYVISHHIMLKLPSSCTHAHIVVPHTRITSYHFGYYVTFISHYITSIWHHITSASCYIIIYLYDIHTRSQHSMAQPIRESPKQYVLALFDCQQSYCHGTVAIFHPSPTNWGFMETAVWIQANFFG